MVRTPRRSRVLFRLGIVLAAVGCSDAQPTDYRTPAEFQQPRFDLSSAFDGYNFSTLTLDDAGPNDTPSQTDLNAFARADNVAGTVAVQWKWDDINSWFGTGQTGDACALFDNDEDDPNDANNGFGNADYAVCVRIKNNPDGTVVQLAGSSPQIYSCGDKKTDRCAQPVAGPLPANGTVCEVTLDDETSFGSLGTGEDGQDVLAACAIPMAAIGNPSSPNLLNVCSFPSGEPNSNPFDCVVTPGVGFLQIVKVTDPDPSNETFSFTLDPASSDGSTSFSLTDENANDEATGLIPVDPGTYDLAEGTLTAGWVLSEAGCVKGDPPQTTGDQNGNTIEGLEIAIGETTICTFENVVGAPDITVTKTADPTEVPETGGTVTYTVEVANDGLLAVELTSLLDDMFGNLDGQGDCAIGGTIEPGDTYSCEFEGVLGAGTAGDTHTNTVTAIVENAGGQDSDADDADVTYTDVGPAITVTKTADPTSVPETGGDVEFTILVENDGTVEFDLTDLTDDEFGDLNGKGTCVTGGTIAVGGSYSCSFTESLSGDAGTSHVNTVTAEATDDDGTTDTDTDDATVTFTDVGPEIRVTKTADPTHVPETGGDVEFTILVENIGSVDFDLTKLEDDIFGDLDGKGDCAIGGTILVGESYSCSFTESLSGDAGDTHTNEVTAEGTDADDSTDTDTDDATVTFDDVLVDISVTKTADPTSLSFSGGGGLGSFTPDRTYDENSDPPGDGGGFEYLSPTCDDAGANDVPAQVDLNCFNRADNVAGQLGVRWTWDDINSWTGSGQTGDGCALLDTDGDGNANVAVCARITNSPDGTQVLQVGGNGAVDVYVCNDNKTDRCAKQVTKLTDLQEENTTCTISVVTPDGIPGGDDGADVQASCVIDLTIGPLTGPQVVGIDLLNVCSFPSGEPNSNPFDCVVRAGAGFIQIVKNVNVTTTDLFGFTLSPASTDGTNEYAVAGGITTGLIPMVPTTGASLTEVLPSGWSLEDASCEVNGGSTGTFSATNKRVSGISVLKGQTTVCTFDNEAQVSGDVEYTIVVTNHNAEEVTLILLDDDIFGDLDEVGDCDVGVSIAGNDSYTCKFTKTISGAPGTSHVNTVTAKAEDDDGNDDTDTDDATVMFENASP